MNAPEIVGLARLMSLSTGSGAVRIGLIDGPLLLSHEDLCQEKIIAVSHDPKLACRRMSACAHGTFVAGILMARRGSQALGICPGCTLLARPIFSETDTLPCDLPIANPGDLASAIRETIDAGARILNLSVAARQPVITKHRELREALDYAIRHDAIVVAAAGNEGIVGGGSSIVQHPAVIPVAACDSRGKPAHDSNLGYSIGRRGLLAPGESIVSLGLDSKGMTLSGTSAATPIVAGTIALLCSLFPDLSRHQVRTATLQSARGSRTSVVPPLLDAWATYNLLSRLSSAMAA